jgi:transposase-like protein
MKKPVTLSQAIAYFADVDRAFDYAKFLRWPDGKVTCPRCESESNSFVKTRKLWFCNGCKKQFTVKVGTIFEDSPMGLDKWMTAVWMICNCKNGISSYEIQRALGITQKSAWFMLHRIREAMRDERTHKFGEGGPVESDEAFIGPNTKMMHRDARLRSIELNKHQGRAIVMGLLDRELRQVRTKMIPNVKREAVQDVILNQVGKNATIYTDNAPRVTTGSKKRDSFTRPLIT